MTLRIWAVIAVVLLVAACGDDTDLSSMADQTVEDPGPSIAADQANDDHDADTTTSTAKPDSDSVAKEALAAEAKEGSDTLSQFFTADISPTSEECMLEGLLDDVDLLAAVVAAGPDAELSDLGEQDQVAAVELGLSCVTTDELSKTIAASFDADLAAEALVGDAADCVSGMLTDESNPDRAQLLLGLVAVSEDLTASPEQSDLLIHMMVECIDSDFLIEATLSGIDNPLLDTAVDRTCLDATVGADSYLEQFWGLFVENAHSEFEDLAPADQAIVVGPFFECVSFGTVIDASAAEAGVELSTGTIACIDDAIDTGTLVDAFVSGEDFDESQFIAAVLPCLTAEELAALGG